MTRILGSWSGPFSDLPISDGNRWQGTISDVGGDRRRRAQRDHREWKILGRRRDRRRQQEAMIGELVMDLADE